MNAFVYRLKMVGQNDMSRFSHTLTRRHRQDWPCCKTCHRPAKNTGHATLTNCCQYTWIFCWGFTFSRRFFLWSFLYAVDGCTRGFSPNVCWQIVIGGWRVLGFWTYEANMESVVTCWRAVILKLVKFFNDLGRLAGMFSLAALHGKYVGEP